MSLVDDIVVPEFEATEKDVLTIVNNISRLVDLELQGMVKPSQGDVLKQLIHSLQDRYDVQFPAPAVSTPATPMSSQFSKKSGFDSSASNSSSTPKRNFELSSGAHRMLSNALNACVKQRVTTNITTEKNAHDEVKKAERDGRHFYSRTRLLELRPTVADTLPMQQLFPRLPGLFIHFDESLHYQDLTPNEETFVKRVQAVQRSGGSSMRKKIGSGADSEGAWERGIEIEVKSQQRQMFGAKSTPHKEYTPSRSHHGYSSSARNAGSYSQRLLDRYGASPMSGKLNIAYDYFGNQVQVDDKPQEKSENAWTPNLSKKKSKTPVLIEAATVAAESEEEKLAALALLHDEQRKELLIAMRGVLNKLSEANMTACVSEQLPQLPMTLPDLGETQCQTVYSQCLRDSAFMPVYAQFLSQLEPHVPLRKIQVAMCQTHFMTYNTNAEQDPQLKSLCKLLGCLYMLNMVVSKVVQAVSKMTLKAPRDGHVDGLVEMLTVSGAKLDEHAKDEQDAVMVLVKDVAQNGAPGQSKRLQFKLKDLISLRSNGWKKK